MADRYRKKPVVIEAWHLTDYDTATAAIRWCGGRAVGEGDEPHIIAIDTMEGTMYADWNDWIIRGVAGEFYPCKPDIFDETYEKVAD